MRLPKDQWADRIVRTVTATEAKAKILALLDEVAAGDEVEITKYAARWLAWCRPAARWRCGQGSQVWP